MNSLYIKIDMYYLYLDQVLKSSKIQTNPISIDILIRITRSIVWHKDLLFHLYFVTSFIRHCFGFLHNCPANAVTSSSLGWEHLHLRWCVSHHWWHHHWWHHLWWHHHWWLISVSNHELLLLHEHLLLLHEHRIGHHLHHHHLLHFLFYLLWIVIGVFWWIWRILSFTFQLFLSTRIFISFCMFFVTQVDCYFTIWTSSNRAFSADD